MIRPVSNSRGRRISIAGALVLTLGAMLGTAHKAHADEATSSDTAPPPAAEQPAAEKPSIDVKKLFAMNCAWCHGGYGKTTGKGPKLAGTKLSAEKVYERIEKGKSGAMPGFAKVLNADQIQAFVDYIKALPDE